VRAHPWLLGASLCSRNLNPHSHRHLSARMMHTKPAVCLLLSFNLSTTLRRAQLYWASATLGALLLIVKITVTRLESYNLKNFPSSISLCGSPRSFNPATCAESVLIARGSPGVYENGLRHHLLEHCKVICSGFSDRVLGIFVIMIR